LNSPLCDLKPKERIRGFLSHGGERRTIIVAIEFTHACEAHTGLVGWRREFLEGEKMTLEQIKEIVALIQYRDYVFDVTEKNGTPFLQARYLEPDIITGEQEWQHTRKWQLSEYMVKSEIVQTALKSVLTSAEHRVREHFLYCGERIFGPHYDVDALVDLCRAKKLDYRGRKAKA
jgi:hypothetical protein